MDNALRAPAPPVDNRKRLPTVERLCPQPGGRNRSFYKFFFLKKKKPERRQPLGLLDFRSTQESFGK
uniref:Uncharacterized protein n=2 Tax=Pseudomonadota TaxID=1224 RepID=A0A5P9WCG7_ALCFA|nr:Hypothetical protein [Providencia rettgeri]QFX79153.1 hypothetical protein pAN70-1000002 [Alcaligenes faecalis]